MTHAEAVSSLASERYLLDEMNEPERDTFETHFFECSECAEDVKMGTLMTEGARVGLIASPEVARNATFPPAQTRMPAVFVTPTPVHQPWYRSSTLPWAVAAMLAVAVGYQAQRPVMPGTMRSGVPEALTAVMLRPASRGAVPTASVVASHHVALALDVDTGGATELSYELQDASAALLASGRASAPSAGAPLLLVIPTFTLKPEQQYILTIRDATNPQRVLGDYHFAAKP
jgi:hypothetical protein